MHRSDLRIRFGASADTPRTEAEVAKLGRRGNAFCRCPVVRRPIFNRLEGMYRPMAKVLLIQKERIFLTMFGRALVKANHEVIATDNFETGRATLAATQPALVLCGFHSAITDDDLEQIARLRATRPDVPIIVLSHSGDETPVLEAMRCGASLVVPQQVSSAQLVDMVGSIGARRNDGRFSAVHERSYERSAVTQYN